jgi:hypothetical protein
MHHENYDLNLWLSRLDEAIQDRSASGSPIRSLRSLLFTDSPLGEASIEHYRKLVSGSDIDLGPSVPADRFVFGWGESSARYLTKVNGLPYRPAGLPWPYDRNGNAMVFLAQFCFADSHDIVGNLPGDVMVVFSRSRKDQLLDPPVFESGTFPERPVVAPWYDDSLKIEWYPIGIDSLITADELIKNGVVFPTCFGVRYRSTDFTDTGKGEDGFRKVVPKNLLSENPFVVSLTLRSLVRHPGMKIGGAPLWCHGPEMEHEGRYIASFGGVALECDCLYPTVNRREPISLRASSWETHLTFGDGGYIHFFVNGDGSVEWEVEYW